MYHWDAKALFLQFKLDWTTQTNNRSWGCMWIVEFKLDWTTQTNNRSWGVCGLLCLGKYGSKGTLSFLRITEWIAQGSFL